MQRNGLVEKQDIEKDCGENFELVCDLEGDVVEVVDGCVDK